MEIEAFTGAAVVGIPLIFVVLGLTAWIKSFGVTGNWLRVASMLVGLVIGVGYMLSLNIPSAYAGWFAVIFYGLGLGVVASGAYDALKSIVKQ